MEFLSALTAVGSFLVLFVKGYAGIVYPMAKGVNPFNKRANRRLQDLGFLWVGASVFAIGLSTRFLEWGAFAVILVVLVYTVVGMFDYWQRTDVIPKL